MNSKRIIPAKPGRQKKDKLPIAQAVEVFLLDCEARQLTASTRRGYRQRLGYFLAYLAEQGIGDLADVEANHLRAYFVSLQERGLAEDTQATSARIIRAFLNFCVGEELLPESPMHKVRLPRPSKRILPALSADDVKELLGVCQDSTLPERDRAIVLCLLDTGCRLREFVGLKVGDVDQKTGRILIHAGKGRKDRYVFLGTRARKALWRYLAERESPGPEEALWLASYTGTPLTVNGLYQVLARLGRRAGVENCNPHTFRRTFALESLRAGMNVYALKELMGHADLQVLWRYLKLVEQDLATAHQQHGAVDSMLRK